MNKKYIGFLLIAVLAVTGLAKAVSAHADDEGDNSGKGSVNWQERMDDRENKMDELRTKMEDRLAHAEEMSGRTLPRLMPMKFGDAEEGKLSKKDIIARRFNFASEALNNIYTRLSTVIDKLDAAGTDMTDAKAKLATAKTKVDAAKKAITDLETMVASIQAATVAPTDTNASVKSLISATDKEKIKSAAEKAKEAAKAAKQALKDVHESIKTALGITDDEQGQENDGDNDANDD
jgi:hypothetical protein